VKRQAASRVSDGIWPLCAFLVTVAGDASSVEIKAFFQAAMKIVLTNLFP
jgi:hypothetical protein